MRQHFFPWLRRWQFPLLLLMSFMPLMLLLLCIDAPDALGVSSLLFLAYAAASGLCLIVPGKRRMLTALLCCAVLLFMTLALLPARQRPSLLLLPAGLCALLLFSLPLSMRRFESEIPPYVYVAGVLVHVFVQFLHHYFRSYNGVSPYDPVSAALTASLVGYILLFLLSLNRISLDGASLMRFHIPAGMRGVNTALTVAFLLLSLLLSVMPAIVRGITLLWETLSMAIISVISFLLSLLPASAELGSGFGGMQEMALMGEEAADPSALAVLLEKILSVVVTIFLIFLLIAFARLLAQLAVRLARRLAAQLRAYMSTASVEYVDEVTDTREDGAKRELRFLRRGKRLGIQLDGSPAGRIRLTYARLLRRHPKWPASSTARENLPSDAAQLYEKVRYGDHPATGEDAKHFAANTRHM